MDMVPIKNDRKDMVGQCDLYSTDHVARPTITYVDVSLEVSCCSSVRTTRNSTKYALVPPCRLEVLREFPVDLAMTRAKVEIAIKAEENSVHGWVWFGAE